MSSLANHIAINHHYTRSTNLERDSGTSEALNGYLPTGRVVEMVDRVIKALNAGTGGAWSVTGPYGSGKSSLGVFLAALLGDSRSDRNQIAYQLIKSIDPSLALDVDDARRRFDQQSFIDALVTSQAEPVTHTITRALERATFSAFGAIPNAKVFPEVKLLQAARSDIESPDPRRTGPSPASLLNVAVALAEHAPLLLVVDEFGKNLEAAQHRPDADLYLLQLLAEASQTERGAPIVLITLQHLAYGDYAAAADSAQQREWAKIQGRFEDVVFVDAPAQTRRLVSSVFKHSDELHNRILSWAELSAAAMRDAHLFDLDDVELIASCYPVHPAALAALPELCRRYGQNERSLFGFLAGTDPKAVPQLLDRLEVSSSGSLPSIGLAEVYDYFATASNSTSSRASRFAEIAVKLRDIAGLPSDQVRVAKCVAVLNLVASNGPLRASPALLRTVDPNAIDRLDDLMTGNVLVHRPTTDEYRVWQGSDVDLEAQLDRARAETTSVEIHSLLTATAPLDPAIAAGHSMRTDTLRTFERCYLRPGAQPDELPAQSPFDGRVYLSLDPQRCLPDAVSQLPLCIHDSDLIDQLVATAREVRAHDIVLADPTVADDWVARNEIRERRADAARDLHAMLDATWNSGTTTLITRTGQHVLNSVGLAALSEAADFAYTATVPIRNETLNRVEVSSIGAKARRLLIQAMLGHETDERLGLDGNGPEVAMYRAVLAASGIHSRNERTGDWHIRQPSDQRFKNAWDLIVEQLKSATDRRINLNDLYATLRLPPIGMKAGPIPLLIHAALIATSDEVALYEHGTFKPALTDEVSDRIVRNPGHFEVKHFANARPGARRRIVEQLAEDLGIPTKFRKHRVGNVLAIVGALVNTVSRLPPITRNAVDLSAHTLAVRAAILDATEPDQLLFTDLPAAVGLDSVGPDVETWPQAKTFAARLVSAISELNSYFDATIEDLRKELLEASAESGRQPLSLQAKLVADEIIHQELRTFALALADDSFDERHWIENLATTVTRTAVRHWQPGHRAVFSTELAGRLAAFRRIQMLHQETRRLGTATFAARRHTVTDATGAENAILIALDDTDRQRAQSGFNAWVDSLSEFYASRAEAEKVAYGIAGEAVLGPPLIGPDVSNPSNSVPNPKVAGHD